MDLTSTFYHYKEGYYLTPSSIKSRRLVWLIFGLGGVKQDSTSGRRNGCDGWFPATRTGQLRGLQIRVEERLSAAEFAHGLTYFSVLKVASISSKIQSQSGGGVKGYTKFQRSVSNRPSAALASQRLAGFRILFIYFVIDNSVVFIVMQLSSCRVRKRNTACKLVF